MAHKTILEFEGERHELLPPLPGEGETKTVHTPGPWSLRVDSDTNPPRYAISGADGVHIVYPTMFGLGGFTETQKAANAQLIGAAPELLHALQSLVAALQHQHNRDAPYWHEARAAIQKAMGQ